MATPTPISTSKTAETVDEKALRAIRAFMGPDASLLEHLPIKSITVDFVEEKRRDNSNLLGIRILFGHLKENDRGEQIWIMLTKSENGDNERSPEQRFNILDRHGRFIRGISGDDAVRQAVIAPAFKCFKQAGKIEMPYLRAVIKYYFILKQVNPPTPWRIDTHFIKLLTLACKAARENIAKAESNRQKDDEREAAAAVYQRREPPTIPRDTANRLARSFSPDDDSLFIPESPHPAAPRGSLSQAPSPSLIPTGPRSASVATPRRIQSAIRHSREFQEGMLPKPAPSKTISQSSEPGNHSSPAHSSGIKANKNKVPTASMAATKVSTPTRTRFPSPAPKPMSTIHARATTKSPTPTPNPIRTNQDTTPHPANHATDVPHQYHHHRPYRQLWAAWNSSISLLQT